MKISYNSTLNANYMIINDEAEIAEDDFAIRMLTGNELSHLLKFHGEKINGKWQFLYDITSLHSFDKAFMNQKLTVKELLAFLRSFRDMAAALEEHLLNCNDILLRPECVYTDEAREKYYFCCVPDLNTNIREKLIRFSADMLMMIDYDDRQAVTLAFDLNRLAASDGFSLAGINKLAEEGAFKAQSMSEALAEGLNAGGEGIARNMYERGDNTKDYDTSAVSSGNNNSFFYKMRGYFKGRKFFEVMDDINEGGVVGRIKSWSKETENADHLIEQEVEAAIPAFGNKTLNSD